MAIRFSPCSRVVEAAPLKAIVLPVIGNEVGIQLREQDLSWKVFLSSANRHPRCVEHWCEIGPKKHLLMKRIFHLYIIM